MTVPWRDRSGRLSILRIVVLLVLLAPGVAAAVTLATATPSAVAVVAAARPITDAIHAIGDWAVRFVLLGLAVTPAARLFRQPRVIGVRRMIGIGAFTYAAVHFVLYIADQHFDLARVASEIVLRIYLTIGFVALLGLTALAVTSTDGMIRRLGRKWRRLHLLIFPITALALLHFFLQTKIDVSQPVLMTGLFVWLLGFRLVAARVGVPGIWGLLALAVASGCLTALIEAGWYAAATGVAPMRVLAANLDLAHTIRPAWWVAAAGVVVALAAAIAAWRRGPSTPPRRAAPASREAA